MTYAIAPMLGLAQSAAGAAVVMSVVAIVFQTVMLHWLRPARAALLRPRLVVVQLIALAVTCWLLIKTGLTITHRSPLRLLLVATLVTLLNVLTEKVLERSARR